MQSKKKLVNWETLILINLVRSSVPMFMLFNDIPRCTMKIWSILDKIFFGKMVNTKINTYERNGPLFYQKKIKVG